MTHTLLLPLLDAAMRGALLAVLALLIFVLMRASSRATVRPVARWLAISLCAGLCVQMIAATPVVEDWLPRTWLAPMVAISVGNAVLFWIFVQALFDDDFALRPMHAIAWAMVALLAGCNCAFVAGGASVFAPMLVGAQRAVPAVFALLAAWVAMSNWRGDLVESRRSLRAFVVAAGIGYTLVMVVARVGTEFGRLDSVMSLVDVAALLAILVPVAALTFRMEWSGLFAPTADLREQVSRQAIPLPETEIPVGTADQLLAEDLHRLMTEECAYRRENMSVSSLAEQLSIPAYRVRRAINQQLGYRNFSVFINSYRLAEVRAVLADSAQQDLPILTVALEAGFQSIGPFNRAFKAMTGLTPSEFRQKHISSPVSPIAEIG